MKKIITEIYGESGTGKTQFCMQMAVQSLIQKYPEDKLGCIFIDTTTGISKERLNQIYSSFSKIYTYFNDNFLKNICYNKISNPESLMDFIIDLNSKNLKENLIIIDTIIDIFQCEAWNDEEIFKRCEFLSKFIKILKSIIYNQDMACIIVNNITSKSNNTQEIDQEKWKEDHCLGLFWGNLINQSFRFWRKNSKSNNTIRRGFDIEYSNYLPSKTCYFQILIDDIIADENENNNEKSID